MCKRVHALSNLMMHSHTPMVTLYVWGISTAQYGSVSIVDCFSQSHHYKNTVYTLLNVPITVLSSVAHTSFIHIVPVSRLCELPLPLSASEVAACVLTACIGSKLPDCWLS